MDTLTEWLPMPSWRSTAPGRCSAARHRAPPRRASRLAWTSSRLHDRPGLHRHPPRRVRDHAARTGPCRGRACAAGYMTAFSVAFPCSTGLADRRLRRHAVSPDLRHAGVVQAGHARVHAGRARAPDRSLAVPGVTRVVAVSTAGELGRVSARTATPSRSPTSVSSTSWPAGPTTSASRVKPLSARRCGTARSRARPRDGADDGARGVGHAPAQ